MRMNVFYIMLQNIVFSKMCYYNKYSKQNSMSVKSYSWKLSWNLPNVCDVFLFNVNAVFIKRVKYCQINLLKTFKLNNNHIIVLFFQSLLTDEQISNAPVLVLGNKIDVPGAASEDEIRVYFGLHGQTTGKVSSVIFLVSDSWIVGGGTNTIYTLCKTKAVAQPPPSPLQRSKIYTDLISLFSDTETDHRQHCLPVHFLWKKNSAQPISCIK